MFYEYLPLAKGNSKLIMLPRRRQHSGQANEAVAQRLSPAGPCSFYLLTGMHTRLCWCRVVTASILDIPTKHSASLVFHWDIHSCSIQCWNMSSGSTKYIVLPLVMVVHVYLLRSVDVREHRNCRGPCIWVHDSANSCG